MISAYIDEETPSLERQALEKHLAACPSCRAELSRQLALKEMVRTTFERSVEIDLSSGIMAMIGAEKTQRPAVKKTSLMKKLSVFMAAAAALFVIAMAAFMTLGNEDTQVAGNEKLEEYVIEHAAAGAGAVDFNGKLATVNLEK